MVDDAAHINAMAERALRMEGHSYGGVVGIESTKHLAKIERDAVGKLIGIVRLV
jgi:surfactin synthase thioesterase subunit